MSSVNPNNFEIGEGDLSLKFEAEGSATDVGGCSGASLVIKPKHLDVDVGQFIDPVDSFIIGREITFSVDLKEDTMRNFVTAIGGDPADISSGVNDESYQIPANSVVTSAFAELIYTVPRVRNKLKLKTIKLFRVKAKDGITYSFNKEKEISYKVTFMAYADPDNDGSPGVITKDNL